MSLRVAAEYPGGPQFVLVCASCPWCAKSAKVPALDNLNGKGFGFCWRC